MKEMTHSLLISATFNEEHRRATLFTPLLSFFFFFLFFFYLFDFILFYFIMIHFFLTIFISLFCGFIAFLLL